MDAPWPEGRSIIRSFFPMRLRTMLLAGAVAAAPAADYQLYLPVLATAQSQVQELVTCD